MSNEARRRRILAGACLSRFRGIALLPLLGAIVAAQTGCMDAKAKAEPQAKPALLKPVKKKEDLFEVKSGTLVKLIQGSGIFVPAATKYVQSTVSGKIAAIPVKQGDFVKQGDVLIELDPGDLKMKIVEQELVVAIAEDQLESAKLARDAERLRLAGLNLQVEQLKLEGLKHNLAKTKLAADRDGIVTFVDFLQPGDAMPAYKDVIGISDANRFLFMYSVSNSTDLAAVELGQEAEVTVGGETYKGKVTQTPRSAPFTDNPVQFEKNSKSILIALDRMPPGVALGAQGELKLVTDKRDNVLIIPRVGLRSYQGRNFVHVKDGESRKEVDVEKGLETATEVEIRKGLKEGQQIILNN